MFTLRDFLETGTMVQGDIVVNAYDDLMNFMESVEVKDTDGLAYYDVPEEFLKMEVEYIFYNKQTEMLVIEISELK